MPLLTNICRLCASSTSLCVSVFGEDGERNSLRHKLKVCSPIPIKRTDELPTQLCLTCLSHIDQYYEFHIKSRSAQLKIRALMKQECEEKKRQATQSESNTKKIKFGPTVLTYQESSSPVLSPGLTDLKKSKESAHEEPEPDRTSPTSSSSCVGSTVQGEGGKSSKSDKGKVIKSLKMEMPSPLKTPSEKEVISPTSSSPSLDPSVNNFQKCQYCDREFMASMLPQHEMLHLNKKVFNCMPCNRSFFNEEAFKRHHKRNHSPDQL